MASRTGTLKNVELIRGDHSAYGGETTGSLKCAIVYVQNDTANTVAGGTDTLDIATLGATMAGSHIRNGKTITVVDVAPAQGAVVGGTSYGCTVAMSSTTLQITPKTSDWSTNGTLPANTSTTQRPYGIFVSYYES